MRSVMNHSFSTNPEVQTKRSVFDRSSLHKTTFNVGDLVPIFWDEILPGDTVNLDMFSQLRLATPIHPIMDMMHVETFWFFVPNRLLWDNWQKFMGEQINPGDSTDFITPKINFVAPVADGDIFNTLGALPIGSTPAGVIAKPWRAYNLIWNNWFRNQNLQNSLTVPMDDGPDDSTLYTIKKRCKRHDYITSCLPWPQKGDSVDIPLGSRADLRYDGTGTGTWLGVKDGNNAWVGLDTPGPKVLAGADAAPNADYQLYADLTDATAATINQLRQAMMTQYMFEKDARYGTRYIEILRARFGVVSPDGRLQRPEFLGGGSSPVNITPIAQTSSTDATTPQGNLSAFGTASLKRHGFTKSFVEHGQLIGLVNVRAELTYQQAINRALTRSTRFDYYEPALAHIGEQAVLNKEVYTDGTSADDDVFGYQGRYDEYRYRPSIITARFSSLSPASLDSWHLSEEFTTRPTLSDAFIQDNTPLDRALAVTTEPDFIGDFYFKYRHARPLPVYGIPGFKPFF